MQEIYFNNRKTTLLIIILLSLISCRVDTENYIQAGYHISDFQWYDNQLYFGAGYCLYQLTPETQTLKTIRCAENQDRIFNRPIIDGKRIYSYVASTTADNYFRYLGAWDSKTDDIIWEYSEDQWSFKNHIFLANDLIYKAEHKKIEAIEVNSGRQKWQIIPGYQGSTSIPFIIQDESLWYIETYDMPEETSEGILYQNDLQTGGTLQGVDLRPKAIFDQLLYVDKEWVVGLAEINDTDQVIAFNQKYPTQIAWSNRVLKSIEGFNQIYRYGNILLISNSYFAVTALDITTGELLWQVEYKRAKLTAEVQSKTIVPFVPFIEGLSPSRPFYHRNIAMYGLDVDTGAVVWMHALEESHNLPLIIEDIVYIGHKATIDAVDLKNGELLWRINLDSRYEYYDPPS